MAICKHCSRRYPEENRRLKVGTCEDCANERQWDDLPADGEGWDKPPTMGTDEIKAFAAAGWVPFLEIPPGAKLIAPRRNR